MTRHQNDVIGVKCFKTCYLACFKTVLYGNVLKHFKNIPHLSQAAACDRILYRVGPEDDNTNPGPGILPI